MCGVFDHFYRRSWFRFGPKPVPRFDPRLWPLSILEPPGSITHSLYKKEKKKLGLYNVSTPLTEPLEQLGWQYGPTWLIFYLHKHSEASTGFKIKTQHRFGFA